MDKNFENLQKSTQLWDKIHAWLAYKRFLKNNVSYSSRIFLFLNMEPDFVFSATREYEFFTVELVTNTKKNVFSYKGFLLCWHSLKSDWLRFIVILPYEPIFCFLEVLNFAFFLRINQIPLLNSPKKMNSTHSYGHNIAVTWIQSKNY